MLGNPPNWELLTGSFTGRGLATQPGAAAVIADSGALPAGLYNVQVSGSYGGTPDVIDNMELFQADKPVIVLPVLPVANSEPSPLVIPALKVYQGQHLTVQAVAAGAVGSVYRAIIIATPVQSQDP